VGLEIALAIEAHQKNPAEIHEAISKVLLADQLAFSKERS
jgi:hypothetical protein